MGKNVAVFVDVANIFYAAKAAGVDIDYVTLLKAAIAGRDFVRAYAYTGLDPENENQRNFHSFLARHGYKVVSKDIRKYGDGKVKANLDIELVVDMMKTARNLDVAIVVSGDGDFAPAIRAVQEMGVRVEVISFRGNTSSDLIEVADIFTDITQIARVDRDSSRSGRRVAGDDEDLSMTEVPDKQTEGRSGRRGRRGRGAERPEAPAAAAASNGAGPAGGGRGRGRTAAARGGAVGPRGGGAAPSAPGAGRIVVLPGEKLSRVQAGDEVPELEEAIEEFVDEAIEELAEGQPLVEGGESDGEQAGDAGRRRRRRGGRGRGRGGRGHEEGLGEAPVPEPAAAEGVAAIEGGEEVEEGELPAMPATAPRPNPFGSVWDSQIGMVGRPTTPMPVTPDEDDYAEPEIPEYLLAERRRGRSGSGGRGQGGGRGARSAYASAMERERFGRSTRYPEPARGPAPQIQRRRDERPPRPAQQPQQHRGPARSGGGGGGGGRPSSEPWSEVPPEVEELLRAQLASKLTRPAAGPAGPEVRETAPAASVPSEPAAQQAAAGAGGGVVSDAAPARSGGRGRGRGGAPRASEPAAKATPAVEAAAETPAPKRAPARRRTAAAATAAPQPVVEAAAAETQAPKRAPARRRTATATAAPAPAAESPAAEGAAPKRAPARRRTAAGAAASSASTAPSSPAGEAPSDAAPGTASRKRAPARRRASAGGESGGDGSGGESPAG